MDRSRPNFICAFMSTRSTLEFSSDIYGVIAFDYFRMYQNFISAQYLLLNKPMPTPIRDLHLFVQHFQSLLRKVPWNGFLCSTGNDPREDAELIWPTVGGPDNVELPHQLPERGGKKQNDSRRNTLHGGPPGGKVLALCPHDHAVGHVVQYDKGNERVTSILLHAVLQVHGDICQRHKDKGPWERSTR